MTHDLEVELLGTSFEVTCLTHESKVMMKKLVNQFTIMKYIRAKGGKYIYAPGPRFYLHDPKKHIYYLIITAIPLFVSHVKKSALTMEVTALNADYDSINLKLKKGFRDRKHQTRYIKRLMENDKIPFKLVDLEPGEGKTYIAVKVALKLGLRIGIILPRWIDKWVKDLKHFIDITDDDVFIVQGSTSIIKLLKRKSLPSIIIFSNRTLSNIISDIFKNNGKLDLGIRPKDLFQVLGIGTIITDESHKEFETLFKNLMLTRAKTVIGLSGSLVSYDLKLISMYKSLFPLENRLGFLGFNKFRNIVFFEYHFMEPDKVRTTYHGSKEYSANAYEAGLIRYKPLLRNYLTMIKEMVDIFYIDKRKEGDKCMVFASSVDMCVEIKNKLTKAYPDLTVLKYTEEDPFDNVLEPDISVTTRISAGEAVDVENLITVIQTANIHSLQATIQIPGRLRKIKDKDVYYVQLWSADIGKHAEYKAAQDRVLRERSKSTDNRIYTNFL